MPEKAAGYVRVSTEQQKEEDSHKRQRERLTSWAENRDYEIDIFEDIAISGQSDDRGAYQDLMDRYEDYDVIVVRELSRMGRDAKKIMSDIEEIMESDTDFISITESFDTTSAMGKAMFRFVAVMNQLYADLARERTMALIDKKKEKGEHWGRPKKFDEEDIEQIREWKDNGLSYGQIKTLVENGGGPFERGDTVSRSTLYNYVQEN